MTQKKKNSKTRIFAITITMLFHDFMFLITLSSTGCLSYNPICWLKKCETDVPSSWQNILYSKYNPYCIFGGCPENKNEREQTPSWKFWNPYILIKHYWDRQNKETKKQTTTINPYCWLFDCSKKKEDKNTHFWNYFGIEGPSLFLHQKYNPVCWAGLCLENNLEEVMAKTSKMEEPSLWSKIISNSHSVIHSTKGWVMNTKPSEIIEILKPPCWFEECCDEYYIPANIEKLRELLKTRIYGQPFIITVADALNSHWNSPYKPTKALVFSFHGWVGSGKTYISNLIAKSLFRQGMKSQYFHHFHGRKDFTLKKEENQYREHLMGWIKSNMTDCPRQLFVFDEVDKMPGTLLDGIKPMIDHGSYIDGVDYGRAVFVFISNTGSSAILERFEQLMQGKAREDVELEDFEGLVLGRAFDEKGGLYQSEVISDNLIDHYIPFLPLERSHIVKCIADEFEKREIKLEFPRDNHIVSEIVNSLHWDLGQNKQFSKSGCKTIGSKVATIYPKRTGMEQKTDL